MMNIDRADTIKQVAILSARAAMKSLFAKHVPERTTLLVAHESHPWHATAVERGALSIDDGCVCLPVPLSVHSWEPGEFGLMVAVDDDVDHMVVPLEAPKAIA